MLAKLIPKRDDVLGEPSGRVGPGWQSTVLGQRSPKRLERGRDGLQDLWHVEAERAEIVAKALH